MIVGFELEVGVVTLPGAFVCAFKLTFEVTFVLVSVNLIFVYLGPTFAYGFFND